VLRTQKLGCHIATGMMLEVEEGEESAYVGCCRIGAGAWKTYGEVGGGVAEELRAVVGLRIE